MTSADHMLKVTMPSTIGFVLKLSKDSFCMIAEIVGAMKFSAVSATTRPRRNASSGILSSFLGATRDLDSGHHIGFAEEHVSGMLGPCCKRISKQDP